MKTLFGVKIIKCSYRINNTCLNIDMKNFLEVMDDEKHCYNK